MNKSKKDDKEKLIIIRQNCIKEYSDKNNDKINQTLDRINNDTPKTDAITNSK
jgi:hypothetical protein